MQFLTDHLLSLLLVVLRIVAFLKDTRIPTKEVHGKIVDILIKSKCMNPVIYFDELDKVSNTPKGDEIIGILTHLIDTTQNTQFHDKYFADIDFDLSKALFIFSYNDESKLILFSLIECTELQLKDTTKKKMYNCKQLRNT